MTCNDKANVKLLYKSTQLGHTLINISSFIRTKFLRTDKNRYVIKNNILTFKYLDHVPYSIYNVVYCIGTKVIEEKYSSTSYSVIISFFIFRHSVVSIRKIKSFISVYTHQSFCSSIYRFFKKHKTNIIISIRYNVITYFSYKT